jgi:transposase
MSKFIRIAIDLGKNYFQVHGLESEGGRSISRKIKRSKVHEVCSQIEPCRVGMEACGSAHYWARELTAMGHEVVLIPPAYSPTSSVARMTRSMRRRSARRCRDRICASCRSRAPNSKRF